MPGLVQVQVVRLLLEALVLVEAMSMAMGVLSLQATIGGQPGQAAAMAKATTMVAGEGQDSRAATSDAADPEQLWTVNVQRALKVVVVVLKHQQSTRLRCGGRYGRRRYVRREQTC